MKKLVLLAALISSCAPGYVDTNSGLPFAGLGIDDSFYQQVSAFEKEWGRQLTNINMFFVDRIDGQVIGQAWWYAESRDTVVEIEKHWWDNNPDYVAREALIFHELGHAVLRRGHVPQPTFWEPPYSLMHPSLTKNTIDHYRSDRDYFVAELFGRTGKSEVLKFECLGD
jgi:hypothetical protein